MADKTHPSAAHPNDAKHRVTGLAADTKRITKKIFHIDNTSEQIDHEDHAVPRQIHDDAGFNPSQTLSVEAGTLEQITAKLPKPHNPKELAHIIRHPKQIGEEKASEALDPSENPHLSREDDTKLINANNKLKELEEPGLLEFGIEERIASLNESIDQLEGDRERKHVAWISSRYVTGAHVMPNEPRFLPFLSTCRWVDERGEPQGAHWSQLTDQYRLFMKHIWAEKPLPSTKTVHEKAKGDDAPEYDQLLVLQYLERILTSSSPIQIWLSSLANLRTWKTPSRTAVWFLIWLSLWTINYIFLFIYLYLAYTLLQSRSTPSTRRDAVTNARARADADPDVTNSLTLSEMISKLQTDNSKDGHDDNGLKNWLTPTIAYLGSAAQPILRTMADWLEIATNYPSSKTTRATISGLVVLIAAALTSTFASTALCIRGIELVAILAFFLDIPLALRFPRYRAVLVPVQWVLWDVPTDAELAFMYLRQRALEMSSQNRHQDVDQDQSLGSGLDAGMDMRTDLFAAHCDWDKLSGSVVLTGCDMRFVRSMPRKEMWRRRFDSIAEMKKGDGRSSMKTLVHHLEVGFLDGSMKRLDKLKSNDEVFNIIFAFSGTQWRQV